MNPFKALTDRFRTPADAASLPTPTDWDRFVEDTIAGDEDAIVVDAMVGHQEGEGKVYRLACPACDRGLRLPEAAIDKRFVCAFCRSMYRSKIAEMPLEVEPAPTGSSLTRWMPPLPGFARSISDKLRSDSRVQSAKSAILSTTAAAASLARPIAGIAAGAASAILPGTGEVLSGNRKWGFCTMAAFFGATAAASAAGGAWIALPIAIRVLSAHQAVSKSETATDEANRQLSANAEEARQVAQELAKEAQRLDDAQFEEEMRRRELEELQQVTNQQLIQLKLIKCQKSQKKMT